MKAILIILLLCLLTLTCAPNAVALEKDEIIPQSDKYSQIDQAVDIHAKALNQQNQQWRSRLKQEISDVKSNQQDLDQRLSDKKQKLAAINQKIAALSVHKNTLTNDYQSIVDDMKLVQGAYQKTIRSLSQQWQQSPTQLIEPQRRQSLEKAQSHLGFPNLVRLNELVTYAVDDMKMTAEITKTNTPISFEDGHVSDENLRVIGGLMAVSDTKTPKFIMFTDKLPTAITPNNSTISHNINQWLTNQTQLLPLDLSQGRMLPSLADKQTFIDWVKKGGEVLWPILILAVIGVIIALWRAVVLFKWRPLAQLINDDIQVNESKVENTDLSLIKQQLLKTSRTPAASVLANAMVIDSSVESMDLRLKQLMLKQMSKFERGLGFIALLAAMAPMLGLLGTVSGMIETFQSLTEFGNSDPKLLSQGISKALITTQAGLLVALPLLLLHYPLKRRAQALSLNMEQQAALLLALFIESGDKHDN
ncbi:MotA/TolQ/ExbB proton channel family protein [Shewanella saliphila]|uniref:Flagellar motor protein MotA n=1 Tax=Shewanella saliphila TaxID=2282698 RepID=A0ABQ2Q043_9GAMM|nr:MotA/TolQ/ExbB proton channel family protein [Shewanella saliphila]MCL1100397.1 MotA/TolQ/ExbB proton channel family protein [Shewanella saliphila]GGP37271.1 flagellar motor protein MotA [Shewanella saliphila]